MQAMLDAQAAALDAMRGTVDKAKAELAEIEATAAQDERDFERNTQLVRIRAVSQSDFETIESKRTVSRHAGRDGRRNCDRRGPLS